MMQYKAKAKDIPFSPYKLRMYADVVRGKNAAYALHWLATQAVGRITPIKKAIESAVANANSLNGIERQDLWISEIRIDQGRIFHYFKPGAMGRATPQRKRFSHISVIVETKQPKQNEV